MIVEVIRIVDRITRWCEKAAAMRHGHAYEDRCRIGQAVKARARLSAKEWREQQAAAVSTNVVRFRKPKRA